MHTQSNDPELSANVPEILANRFSIPAHDPELVDSAVLCAGEITAASVAAFKGALKHADGVLRQRFESAVPVEALVAQRAWVIDQLLIAAWTGHGLNGTDLALLAVGGYGRGELHPGSDVDIAILVGDDTGTDLKRRIEPFITFLWDLGLEIGPSVRTVDQCVEEARADISIVTNLMEARLLCGERALFDRMKAVTGPDNLWPTADFFQEKRREQAARHRKFGAAVQNLEPHIKEGPGGLRDIQMIGWVAKRHFGANTLAELVDHGFLTKYEYQTLASGQAFLWQIRLKLHLLTGRREDRLLFDYQREVAKSFGYHYNDESQLAVERFMKMYYRTVLELNRLNELLMQLFQEAILDRDKREAVTPLNNRFQIRNGNIECVGENVFNRSPFALLEIFLLLQKHTHIKGVRASTIRLLRDSRHLIDDGFRGDIRCRSLFIHILRQPRLVGGVLERMHRYGILAAYLPVFEGVTGLMQFDLFHVYTVDEHALAVVRNMRRFRLSDPQQPLNNHARIMERLPKPELLYIAGLFHDIGKGRGGDHSAIGALDAEQFCIDHGLSKYDTNLVSWLVRNHLSLSMTAQRKDISDPDVVNNFARRVGDKIHLDYLYLLTVADIRGTNPALWNSWKNSLLTELYDKTLRALRRGVENPEEKDERIAETQGEVLGRLCYSRLSKEAIVSFWSHLGEDYFLRHWPDEIEWQTHCVIERGDRNLPLIMVRPRTHRGGTEIFIYTEDKDYIFAATTSTLDQMGLTILDAKIFTTRNGYTLDTYIVLDAATNRTINEQDAIDRIIRALTAALTSGFSASTAVKRKAPRQLSNFRQNVQIAFAQDTTNNRTIMEVTAIDRPGFLSCVGRAMQFCGVRLHNAKVATFGERVEDIFYISDMENRAIDDPLKFECLRNSIKDSLQPGNASRS